MRDDTTFAVLLVLQRAGPNGMDCAAFARAFWPDGGKAKGGTKPAPGHMRTGAGATMAPLVKSRLVVRSGKHEHTRYAITRAGTAFVAEYVRKMHEADEQDVTAGGNPIRLGPDGDEVPLPFPYGVDRRGEST
jgi:hypothetical protein